MSPCEKACGHALGLAGGRWVVFSPEGFGERRRRNIHRPSGRLRSKSIEWC